MIWSGPALWTPFLSLFSCSNQQTKIKWPESYLSVYPIPLILTYLKANYRHSLFKETLHITCLSLWWTLSGMVTSEMRRRCSNKKIISVFRQVRSHVSLLSRCQQMACFEVRIAHLKFAWMSSRLRVLVVKVKTLNSIGKVGCCLCVLISQFLLIFVLLMVYSIIIVFRYNWLFCILMRLLTLFNIHLCRFLGTTYLISHSEVY